MVASRPVSDIIGTAELARRVGKSQRTLRRWLASGVFPQLPGPPRSHRRVSLAALRERLAQLARARGAEG